MNGRKAGWKDVNGHFEDLAQLKSRIKGRYFRLHVKLFGHEGGGVSPRFPHIFCYFQSWDDLESIPGVVLVGLSDG